MWNELFHGISSFSLNEIYLNIHGLLAMMSLIFYGAIIVLTFLWDKCPELSKKLKALWLGLIVTVGLLYSLGLYVYVPYRAKGGAKYILIASEKTAWLHEIVFEHKEFLALAPLILAIVGFWTVHKLAGDNTNREIVKKLCLFCAIGGLLLLLLVAAEAVIVTKAAPVW